MKNLDVNLKVLIAIIALFGLSIGLMAQPQQKQQQFQKNEKGGFGVLNLSDEQKAEIHSINLAEKKEVQPLKDEIMINRAKIIALIHKDDPNMKEIVSLVEANGKFLTDIQIKDLKRQIEFRALLNDEQKVIFDSHYGKTQNHKALAQLRPQRRQHMYQTKMNGRSR